MKCHVSTSNIFLISLAKEEVEAKDVVKTCYEFLSAALSAPDNLGEN
jgi:hypothetical protein